ncbi:MAG TPA: hypothetical protein VFK69_03155 [Candidatus Eisenbacteria bacterium]|nr:hypothetical protein [Candidatus Eisenbacteria bacterium]
MRQGRMILALAAALLFAVALPAHAAKSPASPASRASAGTHQFTGVVTALDHGSITVERSGRRAKTMVFVKHEPLTTTGDVAKNARVTVWYHDEDGHPVATRIVVRSAETAAR